jgi:hypothetical protein
MRSPAVSRISTGSSLGGRSRGLTYPRDRSISLLDGYFLGGVLVVPGAGAEDENEDRSLVTGRGEAALLRSMDRDRAPRTDMVTATDMAMGLEGNSM